MDGASSSAIGPRTMARGLESRHVSRHFARRAATKAGPGTGAHHRQRAWPKLTAVVDVASHLILGAVPGEGPSQDSPDFAPALRQACAVVHVDTALADAGLTPSTIIASAATSVRADPSSLSTVATPATGRPGPCTGARSATTSHKPSITSAGRSRARSASTSDALDRP
jgi:hypothetical protein